MADGHHLTRARPTDKAGTFAAWQPRYAEHGIATFPVRVDERGKRPAVKGYLRLGSKVSEKLALRFPEADALGFVLGRRSRLTIVDVDTTDERVLADALDRHGPTPIIVRSGSGNFQAWYKHNGETRQIRPVRDRPIDILGGGFVVAPPSRGIKGDYQFIQGDLDDLDGLPIMQNVKIASPPLSPALPPIEAVSEGYRNKSLWEHCMRTACTCDNFDNLLDITRTRNAEFLPPLVDAEVVKIAKSAWSYTERGENRFGQTGAWFPTAEANTMIASDQDAFLLLAFLRANNGPQRTFMVANGLAGTLGWTRKRLAGARLRLQQSHITMVRRASEHYGAAIYRWHPKTRDRG
jgi:hypothetical protein